MIEVQNLTKYYGDVAAIKNVSFTVEKGEILGFLGPNAAGKTTTMRILTGYMPPTSGNAKVAGFDILTQSLEVRRRLGYVPENIPLYPEMRVESYLNFVAEIKGVPARKRKSHIGKIMELCGIKEVPNYPIRTLSKGFRQRVGIAQALINDPEIIILDEPTIGLDPKQIIEIRELIKSLGENHTVILSTHILPEVSMTCSRVLIINKGTVIAEDTPENLTKHLAKSIEIHLLVEGPEELIKNALSNVKGVMSVSRTKRQNGLLEFRVQTQRDRDLRKELASLIVNKGWGLYEIKTLEATLEQIFVELVTEEKEV